jgi:acyl-CoA thioester hydrolase
MKGQEFTWPVRVYYEDTDAGGIVFYANYLKFFERARTEWLRASGVNQQKMKDDYQCMFVVKATAVEYHAPARLDDELKLTVTVERLGRASVHFVQEALCGDRLLVTGKIKVGCVDAIKVRPTAIPNEIFDLIAPAKQ